MLIKSVFTIIFLLTTSAIVIPTNADQLPIIHNPPTKQEAGKTTDSKENSKAQNQNSTPPLTIINPTPSPPLQEIRENKSSQYGQEQTSSWWDFSLTDVLLAIFTCGLVIVGWFQVRILRGTLKVTDGLLGVAQEQSGDLKASIAVAEKAAEAAEDSVQVAKKSLNTTRRAYVFLKDIEVRETQGRGSMSAIQGQMRWQLFPRWQNSGDTPTRNLTISVGCKVSERELPDNFMFPYTNEELSDDCEYSCNTQRNIPMVIGPKADIITVPLLISETHNDIARIMSDHLFLYVWGEAKYIDVFDATLTHCTRFFVKLSFPEKFIEQPLLIYYEKYTCADEDCNKQS